MPVSPWPSSAEMLRFLPEIILTLTACGIMVAEPLLGSRARNLFGHLSIAALAAAIAAALIANGNPGPAFQSMLIVDGFATFFRILIFLVGILAVFASYRYLEREGAGAGEYYTLVLFSIAGQGIMAAANELIMIFIGLEISSIASYVLAGYLREDKRSNEAALKYFLLGSFATAFFLYGVALIYGSTQTTNLALIRGVLAKAEDPSTTVLLAIAAALVFVGLCFKVSGAPFQMWAPDVYQGAPAPVAAFLSAGPKAAAFAVFLRIFRTAFDGLDAWVTPVLWASALLSMTIGNFAALAQTNIKRMLAYSSIAHAGYVLVAIAAHSEAGTAAAMFYLAAYALMNLGAFAIVTHVAGKGEKFVEIKDLAGLGKTMPLAAATLTICLLSLIGVPLTGGFFGKFYIFKAALEADMIWLTVLGLLNSAVAAFYYLRLLVVMYMHEPGEAAEQCEQFPLGLRLGLAVSAIGLLVLGIFPGGVLDFAIQSAKL